MSYRGITASVLISSVLVSCGVLASCTSSPGLPATAGGPGAVDSGGAGDGAASGGASGGNVLGGPGGGGGVVVEQPDTAGGDASAGGAGGGATMDAAPSDAGDATSAGGGKFKGRATKSAGCGKPNPPSGLDLTITVQGKTGHYILTLPANYDPNTPYPLAFGFHGHGQTGQVCYGGASCSGYQSTLKNVAVVVYPTTLSPTGGWEAAGANEREINVTYFSALLAKVEDTYCINPTRVFVAGTSSGASFSNILGCRFADVLLAVAPVDGIAPATMGETNCKGAVGALAIHGYKDSHVPFAQGEKARDYFRSQDHCTSTATPPVAQIHAAVVARPETHGCSMYEGCDPGVPVMWCEHSEGGYDGSTHGWPKFGGQAIWDFVKGL